MTTTHPLESKPILLVSLGTSPAVVPEAFLIPDTQFKAVHVLTTAKTEVDEIREWFGRRFPEVELSMVRVAEFTEFRGEEDHFRFEEVLYRWWLEKVGAWREGHVGSGEGRAGSLLPHVCLSGGFKTMSAAMQKAASIFGAAEVFHVLCDLPPADQPRTGEEAEEAGKKGCLRWIRLGPEAGWPQVRGFESRRYPLVEAEAGDSPADAGMVVKSVSAPDTALRGRIGELAERTRRIAESWDRLADLPFPELATWSAADRAWLREPLDPEKDREWVAGLPKIDLHCHLGGFATHGEALAEIRAAAENPEALPPLIVPELPDAWPLPDAPISLSDYMKLGDANGSALLRDPGCLRRHCELLYDHLVRENVVYAEIRCSPANYADPARGRSPWDVLTDIKETFDRCREVAAGFQPDGSVPPGFQPGGADSSTHPDRAFHPFDPDLPYAQTWRELPHREQSGTTAFVTFRLADSLPRERVREWEFERRQFLATHPKPWTEEIWKSYRRDFPRRLEGWLDEAHGACHLRNSRLAAIVEAALRHFDGKRYVLDAFAIMPNHVHVLVKPLPGNKLSEIVHSWKSFTANEINRALKRTGPVWQQESFDHLVRSSGQLVRLRDYIGDNPEKAGTNGVVGMGMGLVSGSGGVGEGETPGWKPEATDPSCWKHVATPHINLLIIGTRRKEGDHRTAILRHLMLAITAAEHWPDDPGCRVVGVDLAGFEDRDTRAHYYREDFRIVHRAGLALTVHAGENDDSEGVWSAVFDLNTRRIGHALSLGESPELLRSVADRRIGVEMCPFANYQIKGFHPMPGKPVYPLKRYLDAGVPVTINTDNIGISAASLTDNLLLAARLCPDLSRMDLLRLLRNALETAFLPHQEKRELLRLVESADLAPH